MKPQKNQSKSMKIDTVLNINVAEKIDVQVNGEEESLTLYEAARWASLMKGLDYIDLKAEQLKIDLTKDKTWLKPLALQKYIDEETPSVIANIKNLKDTQG